MRPSSLLPLLSLPFLAACFGPGLAGDWEGEIDCGDGGFDVVAELESDGGGDYSGELEFAYYDADTQDGVFYELELVYRGELEVETDGFGEQELDEDFELDEVICRGFIDGELVTDSCEDLGIEVDFSQDGDLGDLTWDGEDTIEIEDGDCEGELERD